VAFSFSEEAMVRERKFLLQTQVDRAVYFQFKELCKAHKITVAAGVDWALRTKLTQAGIRIRFPDENIEGAPRSAEAGNEFSKI
jgi:hypothetical protein